MKRLLQTILGCISMLSVSAQNTFTSGNLVVLQTSGTASKASSPVTLKEFTTTGTAGMTVSIPTTGPTPFQSGGIFGGSEGFLSTSTDGKYLVLGGYATAATFGDITATNSSSVTRAIGLVYPSGFYLQVDTSNTFYSLNDIRGGVSDGSNFWASGASAATDGIDYFYPGPHIALANAAPNPPKAYGLRIFNGNIYYATQKAGPTNSSSQLGISQLGTGLPTSGAVTVSQIINVSIPTPTAIPEDFSFNPAFDVCYIAINLNTAVGGIQKWTRSGAVWSLAYTLGTGGTNAGAYGLVVDYSGAQPVLYATTFEGTAAGNRVVKIIDVGAGSVATTIVAATANTFYKGISFAPIAPGTPIVNISVSKDTASEAAISTVTVTANVSTSVTTTQTVTVGVSGTGITAGDYSLSSTTITIPAGATSGSVTFTVVDDILGEGTEVANLTISSPSAGLVLGMRPTQKITIADNDGNNHPTISLDVSTTDFIDGGVLVSPASPFKMSGVISDPTDPGRTLGTVFLVNDLETAATSLTVTATSGNTTVVPNGNLAITGTGALRTVKITPAAIGYADITVSVSDGIDITTYVLNYAVSGAAATPSVTVWHTGLSDASDAIAQDDNYYITGDDELDLLNVYSRTASGLPLKSYDYASNLNLPDLIKPEVDVEAAAVSPSNSRKSYWLGSMSNGKAPFDNKPNRDRIFATTYSGTGASTSFIFAGYAALRTTLLAWGDANGYNFTASAAAGVDSKALNGFAAEGMVFGPDNTTLFIGLRAPLVPTATRTRAVIAPILNFETWFNNGTPLGSPAYGSPIELDLGGRGIRDLIRLSDGTYVIIAGSSGATSTGAIYKWRGLASEAPILVPSAVAPTLNMEGAMQINTSGLLSLTSLQVVSDMGDDILYNDGNAAKDFGDLMYRKFRTDVISGIDLSYPEANVTGNGINIADGSTTISATNNTDFGGVAYGSTTTKTFVVQNLGTGNLVVSGISFTGSALVDYGLSSTPTVPFNIAANGTFTITVQFSPTALGLRNATLNITTNDADESIYNFDIRGNGLCNPFTAFSVSGGGPRCSGGPGVAVNLSSSTTGVNYQLYRGSAIVGSPVAGTGSLISFGLQTAAGIYSVSATHSVTGCTADMTGGVAVTINTSPALQTFTGGGGYCAGIPGGGVNVGLTLTETGVSYQLFRGTTTVGSPINGTGAAIDFGVQSLAGIYSVAATNLTSFCSTGLPGVTVHVNALPDVFSMTGGGSYCSSDPGLHVGLTGSATGINYQLYNGSSAIGTPKPGTGAILDFGLQTAAGAYTAIATNTLTLCPQNMASVVTVTVIPVPNDFTLSGSGTICANDSGIHVRLSGSNTGIRYQLYRGSTLVGSAISGTGSALDFGLQITAGTYTAVATNTLTACSKVMSGSGTINVNPIPSNVYNTTGGGSYCTPGAGVHVGVNNSDVGFRYQLSRSGVLVGSFLNGTNAALDFGFVTIGGIYKTVAINPGTGCMRTMSDSAVVTPVLTVTPTVDIFTGGSSLCNGSPVTLTALTVNGGGAPTYQWSVNGTLVSTASTYSYLPQNGDLVRIRLRSNAQCVSPDTAVGNMVMNLVTPPPPSVFIDPSTLNAIAPGQSDTLRAIATNCGTSPTFQWYKNGSVIPGATTAVYISNTFVNRDSMSVRVITSGVCGGILTYNSIVIIVFPVAINQVAGGSDIQLFPNPNMGTFTVKGSLGTIDDQEVSLIVTDLLGKVIYRNNVIARNGNLNEQILLNNSLANGMYMLELRSDSGNKVFRFVIGK